MKLETAFSRNALKNCIPQFKQLVMEQPDDFSTQLSKICSSVGIKVIYMNHITHTPVNGCARWIGDVPCVQMTDKQKRNDVFWFSFFHELGHIALHGKKDLFIENEEHRKLESEMSMYDYAPLFQFLLKKVGCHWDEVWKECQERLNIIDPILIMVVNVGRNGLIVPFNEYSSPPKNIWEEMLCDSDIETLRATSLLET